jgi:hypothetical protein
MAGSVTARYLPLDSTAVPAGSSLLASVGCEKGLSVSVPFSSTLNTEIVPETLSVA